MINMDSTFQSLGKGFTSHRHTGREVSIPDLDRVEMSDRHHLHVSTRPRRGCFEAPTVAAAHHSPQGIKFPLPCLHQYQSNPQPRPRSISRHPHLPSLCKSLCATRRTLGLFITADSFFASRSRLEMNFAHIICQRVIGGRAVNPSRGYFWLQFMLLPCNATDRAEVHNLPTLEEESPDEAGKGGQNEVRHGRIGDG